MFDNICVISNKRVIIYIYMWFLILYTEMDTQIMPTFSLILGVPRHEQPSPSERNRSKSLLELNWSLQDLEDFIINSFPDTGLSRVGFQYARSTKNRKLQILTPGTVGELRELCMNSVLYVVPNRDIVEIVVCVFHLLC